MMGAWGGRGGGRFCPQLATSDFRFYTSDFRDHTSEPWDQTSENAKAAASDTGVSKLTIFYGLSVCIARSKAL